MSMLVNRSLVARRLRVHRVVDHEDPSARQRRVLAAERLRYGMRMGVHPDAHAREYCASNVGKDSDRRLVLGVDRGNGASWVVRIVISWARIDDSRSVALGTLE